MTRLVHVILLYIELALVLEEEDVEQFIVIFDDRLCNSVKMFVEIFFAESLEPLHPA